MGNQPNAPGSEKPLLGTIFGVSHIVLAEVASRAAREAAIEHVKAGRLHPSALPPAGIADRPPTEVMSAVPLPAEPEASGTTRLARDDGALPPAK